MASPDPVAADLPPAADAVSPRPPSPPSPPPDEAAAAEAEPETATKMEEETGAEVTPSVPGRKKRGRKRKEPGEVKEEGTEKKPSKPRKPRVVSTEKSVERPCRERKTVVRLIQMSPPTVPVSKVLTIAQGKGTKLKDIPNVAFKLSKRKIDENLQLLHTVMFGKKTSAYYLKKNISQFSGFVWAENEEKQRTRAKEKLDKCTKDRLLDFSELLDIQIARNMSKKEEITAQIYEFLDSPHATRDIVLAESEQKGKRKRRSKGVDQPANTGASSDGETKKQKGGTEIEGNKKRKQSSKIQKEDENQDVHDEKEDDSDGSSDEEEDLDGSSPNKDDTVRGTKADSDTDERSDRVESEGDDGDGQEDSIVGTNGSEERRKTPKQKTKEKGSSVKKIPPAKSDKGPIKPALEDASSDDEDVPPVPAPSKRGSSKGQASTTSRANKNDKSSTVNKGSSKSNKSTPTPRKSPVNNSESVPSSSSKSKRESKKKDHRNDTSVPEDTKAVKKQAGKGESKVSTKEQEKGKASRKPKVKPPTREELYAVISKILKKVDFNTATLADILKQLGKLFKTNLMDRKAEVKEIIQEVINEMPDEEDSEEDGEEDEKDARSAEAEDDAKQESDEDDE